MKLIREHHDDQTLVIDTLYVGSIGFHDLPTTAKITSDTNEYVHIKHARDGRARDIYLTPAEAMKLLRHVAVKLDLMNIT